MNEICQCGHNLARETFSIYLGLTRSLSKATICFNKMLKKKPLIYSCKICSFESCIKGSEFHDFSENPFLMIRIAVSVIKNNEYHYYKTKINGFNPKLISINGFNFKLAVAIKYYNSGDNGKSGHYSCIIQKDDCFFEISDDKITLYPFKNLIFLEDICILFLEKI
jgi:hypothetical protein